MAMTPERTALLQKKSQDYVSGFEKKGSGINFDALPTDTLLILEAWNDWSGRALAEGGDLRLVAGGADPACATVAELNDLVKRAQRIPAALYPVSGFTLSEEDTLRFSFAGSAYRMNFHEDGSRASAIGIAETKHIADVDVAMQLWVACATEDCMAYLEYQAGLHSLYLDEESQESARRIIGAHLQRQFSIGQIWNAVWRSVKDAAALSKHRYWNSEKAAKKISKKIDKVLLDASSSADAFTAYDRLEDLPPAAVLTLFRHRFGIGDTAPGPAVRACLEADHALASPDDDDEFGIGDVKHLIRGVFYFKDGVTDLDRLVLSSFKGIEFTADEPDWDDDHILGELSYTLETHRAFDGVGFAQKYLRTLGKEPPSEEEVQAMAVAAAKYSEETGQWADKTGYHWAYMNVLEAAGVAHEHLGRAAYAIRFSASPDEVVEVLEFLPGEFNLVGVRAESTSIYGSFSEKADVIRAAGYSFKISNESLEPEGSDDQLITGLVDKNLHNVAYLIGDSVWNSLTAPGPKQKSELVKLIAQRLDALAAEHLSNPVGPTPA